MLVTRDANLRADYSDAFDLRALALPGADADLIFGEDAR
jgi:hypothetical protein